MEVQNFLLLHMLLIEAGTGILRKIFKQRYRQLKNAEWENSDKSSGEFLESFFQACNPFPLQKDILKEKDLTKFDISLLSNLITHLNNTLEGQGKLGGNLKPQNSAISELVKLRNELAHLPNLEVNAEYFEILWGNISRALVRLGVTQDSINKVRNITKVEEAETVRKKLTDLKIKVADGDLARGRGDYDTAISFYSSALLNHYLREEERLSILMNRSEALIASIFGTASLPSQNGVNEKCERAMADVEEIIRRDPTFYKAFLMAGKIHQCTKSWESAIRMFDQALALKPGLPEALKRRNECKNEIHKVEDGIEVIITTIIAGLLEPLPFFT